MTTKDDRGKVIPLKADTGDLLGLDDSPHLGAFIWGHIDAWAKLYHEIRVGERDVWSRNDILFLMERIENTSMQDELSKRQQGIMSDDR